MDAPVRTKSKPAFHEKGPVEFRLLIWPTVFAVRDGEVENWRGEGHSNEFLDEGARDKWADFDDVKVDEELGRNFTSALFSP